MGKLVKLIGSLTHCGVEWSLTGRMLLHTECKYEAVDKVSLLPPGGEARCCSVCHSVGVFRLVFLPDVTQQADRCSVVTETMLKLLVLGFYSFVLFNLICTKELKSEEIIGSVIVFKLQRI